jgi:signal transduction histidine kinase
MRTKPGTTHQAPPATDPQGDASPAAMLPAAEDGQPVGDRRTDDRGARAHAPPVAMLTTLFTHLPCGVIVVDAAGRVVFMNEVGERLSSEMQLGDRSVAGNVVPDHSKGSPPVTHGMRVASALAGNAVPDLDYVRGHPSEAQHRVVQVAITPLRERTAQVTGALLTLTDLTERLAGQATLARKAFAQAQDNRDLTRSNTELEQQAILARAADALAQGLRETLAREAGALARIAVAQAKDNRDLTRSNTGLEQFAAVASHDLQEPLRKIQSFGDRLKSVEGATLSAAGADYLARMQHAAARMQVLIHDLLTYARVSAGQGPTASVDLHALTRAVLTDLETRVALSGGRVDVGPLPTIEGDPLRLRQLLQNLISNALKFCHPEVPPVVTISAMLLPQEGSESTGPASDAPPPGSA